MSLSPNVRQQIDRLTLHPSQPLLVTDADEVLLRFVAALEKFLHRNQLWLDLSSYSLVGNIKHQGGETPLPAEHLPSLMDRFFSTEVPTLEPVPGAAETLRLLARRVQIVVLTNVPQAQLQARADNLARHGMPYPVIANQGLKGSAIAHLAQYVEGPLFFLDDAPQNLVSAKEQVAECVCIHYVADERLSKVIELPPLVDHRAQSWSEILNVIEARLEAHSAAAEPASDAG